MSPRRSRSGANGSNGINFNRRIELCARLIAKSGTAKEVRVSIIGSNRLQLTRYTKPLHVKCKHNHRRKSNREQSKQHHQQICRVVNATDTLQSVDPMQIC